MDEDAGSRLTRAFLMSTVALGGLWAYSYFTAPETPEPVAEAGQAPRTPAQAPVDSCRNHQGEESLATLETPTFRATVSNLSGGIKSLELTLDRYQNDDGSPLELVTTQHCDYYPFQLEVGGLPIKAGTPWNLEQTSPGSVTLSKEQDGVRVERVLRVGDAPYQLWSSVKITNHGSRSFQERVRESTYHYVRRELEGGGIFASRSHHISHAICRHGEDDTTRMDREDSLATEKQPKGHGFGPPVLFAGVENAFFANVLSAGTGRAHRCHFRSEDRPDTESADGSLFFSSLVYDWKPLAPGATQEEETMLYMGPKDHAALVAAGHQLTEVVDLGWFALVARWLVALLRFIQSVVGNWGLAIIVMTVLVRVVMFPLTWKSFQSMARMRVLKPEMDRINELYADDREKKGAAVMELYRKHKINPLGGCLPQLLQMPIWFAFYASLSTNVELYRAEFALWWTDLSAPDPYYALPLLLGALMHFQQRITPAAMDPAQQKMMMYMMPIMITVFMLFLPAGLCLYMATNSILGIVQQQWIQRGLDTKNAAAAGGADPSGNGPDDGKPSTGPDTEDAAAQTSSSDAQSIVHRMKPRSKAKPAKRRTRRARS